MKVAVTFEFETSSLNSKKHTSETTLLEGILWTLSVKKKGDFLGVYIDLECAGRVKDWDCDIASISIVTNVNSERKEIWDVDGASDKPSYFSGHGMDNCMH